MIVKATMNDVQSIHDLLGHFARKESLLSRSLSELYSYLRDFFVFRNDDDSRMVGVCGLHICWDNLAEIRSLAVQDTEQGHGVGRALVEACLSDAVMLGIYRIFALTYVPEFFVKQGFKVVPKDVLPHKVWADCLKCPKFPNCDETAVLLEL
ncbi:MAG: N-acetyltransferase [Deltaproteobacteria bacterium]|nr:N-acetyltransferase [Deltaproteobacteria bacterium]